MTAAHQHQVERIGKHLLEYEDELLHVHWASRLTLEEWHQIYSRIEAYVKSRDTALILFDLRDASDSSREQRQASATWWRRQRLETVALAQYGLSTKLRIFVNLTTRAVGVLAGKSPHAILFETEAESRAWLATIKPKLIAAHDTLTKASGV